MITPEHCRMMARYNRWMNERIYAAAATLPDDERKRDRGAFFKSLHGTLAHLVWADRVWIARFTGTTFSAPQWGQGWIDDFAELVRERDAADGLVTEWAERITHDELGSTLRYLARDGKRRASPLWMLAAHCFNHQTHHRGQATTLLSQMGVDPGVTDLLFLPGVTTIEG